MSSTRKIPVLDLKLAEDASTRGLLLGQLHDALFNIGFLYISNHGISEEIISALSETLPALFHLPLERKRELSKTKSPQFLGFSDFAQETTQGKLDLREQYDIATELPEVYQKDAVPNDRGRDFSNLYWRLRGPNVWPSENEVPGFKKAANEFVHLVEEAFGIPRGTFDSFFNKNAASNTADSTLESDFLPPQHRLRLNFYPAMPPEQESQGVGPHKDMAGWLTFLHQVGSECALEVQDRDGSWIFVDPIPNTLVVNLGYAFEAATEGAARATVHRVRAPSQKDRYSIPFFMALPLELKLSEVRSRIPESVRAMRRKELENGEWTIDQKIETFLDPRWDNIGESVLRRFIRGYKETALKFYGQEVYQYYTQ
ncbi:hypothetical protein BDV41DRAFT_580402 [Aspergillus transmontanensis]|uniref:Fe2OG dioxygenase domain-containing protein n=1 Tax=Aspergillus transmontanensis TaxID=1034304 RepID=A0A5N6VLL3_9EURO|nr:hypothetical protein BDV41DRAFT_580402 [Aspergillus transmontanensis]